MKSSVDKTLLDDFIRKTLKSTDDPYTPFDWSELDVLLNHEQHALPVKLNKKNLFLAGGIIAGILILFIIFRIANYYSSLPDIKESALDTTQQILLPIDSLSETITNTDSLQKDTLIVKSPSDSIGSLNNILPIDSSSISKVKVMVPGPAPAVSKKDKKRKTDTLPGLPSSDSLPLKKEPAPALIDTSSSPVIKEAKIEVVSIPDSTSRPSPPANQKKKKAKEKKTSPPPVAPRTDIPAVQPDSLKQQ